jgi:hypothetical protein
MSSSNVPLFALADEYLTNVIYFHLATLAPLELIPYIDWHSIIRAASVCDLIQIRGHLAVLPTRRVQLHQL